VRQVLPELKRLNRLAAKDRRRYLKTCGGPFVDCVCECIRNLLKGRVPLRPKQVKALRRYKWLLRQAASKKTPPERASADPTERRIYRCHIAVAHIGAGCYNQSAGQSDGKQ
jgi:hypothetical protein